MFDEKLINHGHDGDDNITISRHQLDVTLLTNIDNITNQTYPHQDPIINHIYSCYNTV